MKKLLGLVLTLAFVLTLIPAATLAEANHECVSGEWVDGGCVIPPGPGKHYYRRYCIICDKLLEELAPLCCGDGKHVRPAPIYPIVPCP